MSKKGSIYFTGRHGFIGRHLMAAIHSKLDIHDQLFGYNISFNHTIMANENDLIIHLAAVTHTRQEFDPKLINVNYVFASQVMTSRARIIYASSCSARYDTSPYAQSKMYAEHLGNIHGNALGLRFFNVYGPGNNKGIVKYLMDAKSGANILIRGDQLVRDYVFVTDVVDQILYYIENPQIGIREVGTGIGTSTIQLVSTFSELSGKIFNIECIDPLPSDPQSMVAIKGSCPTPLRIGLAKTILE